LMFSLELNLVLCCFDGFLNLGLSLVLATLVVQSFPLHKLCGPLDQRIHKVHLALPNAVGI